METVLLMGGRSFIGGHVCRALIKRGYKVLLHSSSSGDFKNLGDILPHPQVTVESCSYEDKDHLAKLMAQAQFLIFQAAPPGKQTLGQKKAKEHDFDSLKNILDVLAASPIKKSVFISTCHTIGDGKNRPADEECIVTKRQKGWLALPWKFKMEKMVVDYSQRNINIVVVNPTMFVGDYDTKPSTGEFFVFIDPFPFNVLSGVKINIIDVADAALGAVLALEKGRAGEKYLLGGENIVHDELVRRIKKCGGRKMPPLAIPVPVTVAVAFISECVNLVLRQEKPAVPLLAMELQLHAQHYSSEKAKRELGFIPGDTWSAVDRAYQWYKSHGMLKD